MPDADIPRHRPTYDERVLAPYDRCSDLQGYEGEDIVYASPAEAKSFSGLPDAYVETAEFDSLRDEGIAYANLLKDNGIDVVLRETKGTMHGYDIVAKSSVTKESVTARIDFLKTKLYK